MNLNKTEIELIQYCLNHTLRSRPWISNIIQNILKKKI